MSFISGRPFFGEGSFQSMLAQLLQCTLQNCAAIQLRLGRILAACNCERGRSRSFPRENVMIAAGGQDFAFASAHPNKLLLVLTPGLSRIFTRTIFTFQRPNFTLMSDEYDIIQKKKPSNRWSDFHTFFRCNSISSSSCAVGKWEWHWHWSIIVKLSILHFHPAIFLAHIWL